MRAVIYARYSGGPNQTEQSIEGQVRDCMRYANENNIDVVGQYIDRAISGTDFVNRYEFLKMIDDCKKNIFDAIIVWKIDRFGRDRQEIAINKVKLKKYGVKLLYAAEHIPDGPEGIILESLLEGMAEYYSAELSQKVRRGLRESALKGHVLGNNKCFGYDIKEKKYVLNEYEAPIVRMIFREYSSGITSIDIAKKLMSMGVLSKSGKPISSRYIMQMLRNEKYIGIYRYTDIVLYDVIEPIVDKALWESVQKAIQCNTKHSSRKRKEEGIYFYLTGLIKCCLCGSPIIGESGKSHTGKTYYYYKCATKKNRTGNCCQINFRKEELEDWIVYITMNDVLNAEVIDQIADSVIEIQNSDTRNLELERLEAEYDNVTRSINNLVKAIEAGAVSETTTKRISELEVIKKDLSIAISELKIAAPSLTKEHVVFFLESMIDGDINDVKFKEKILEMFVNKIEVYKNHMIIYYNYTENEGLAMRRIEKDGLSEMVRIDRRKQVRTDSIRTIYIGLYYFAIDINFDMNVA